MKYKHLTKTWVAKVKGMKYYMLAITTALAVFTVAGIAGVIYNMENPKLSNSDFIRLHVVANSDTYEDQALKLKIRDKVLELMADKMTELGRTSEIGKASELERASELGGAKISKSAVQDAAVFIKGSFPQIKRAAEEVIRENGFDYDVSLSLAPRYIPEKTYRNTIFPAGEYEALNISIGEAKGGNWWCVLFPPLCLIDTSPEANKAGDDAVKIELKFKSKEVLENIFNEGK